MLANNNKKSNWFIAKSEKFQPKYVIYSNNGIRLCNAEEREFTHDEKVNLCGVQIYLML